MRKMTILALAALFAAFAALPALAQQKQPYQIVMEKLGTEKESYKLKINKWKFSQKADIHCTDPNYEPKGWKTTGLGYMFPEAGDVWFRAKFVMPETIEGKSVKGSKVIFRGNMVPIGSIFINGKFENYFRRDDGEAVLTTSAVPGEEYIIVLQGVNRRDIGLFADAYVTFSALEELSQRTNDYLNSMKTVEALLDLSGDREKWTAKLNESAALVDIAAYGNGDEQKYFASLAAANNILTSFKEVASKYTMYLLGYSHIDLAWLWDKHEGEDVWRNTSDTILKLMNEYPEWTYNAGQAHGYAWMENDYPEIFEQIKKRVAEGRWEVVGGAWAEHDGNVPSGESFVRHYLYGKRYFKSRFGKDVTVGWTPDSFGYNLGLPQIMRRAGIKSFLTQKISWNDTTKFPHHIFWWEGPDGSKILVYFPVGGYCESNDTGAMLGQLKEMVKTHNVPENLMIFGVGDHGGGVTRTHLNRAFALKNSAVFPPVKFTTADEYFAHLVDLSKTQTFPTWSDELYLEYHRGTYTTQSNTKRNNRLGEVLQEEGEKFASVASVLYGLPYPAARIRDGWNILLFNHFHDILPGSSINDVYKDADTDYAEQQKTLGSVIDESLATIEKNVNTAGKGMPVTVFNPLGWARDGIVEMPFTFTMPADPVVLDAKGNVVPSQISVEKFPVKTLVFVARGVPAGGYAVYRIAPAAGFKKPATDLKAYGDTIENKYIKLTFDPKSGNIVSLVDKATGREIIDNAKGANFVQLFDDRPAKYDAWEIALGAELPMGVSESARIVEAGPVKATVAFTRKTSYSEFTQYISLYENDPLAHGRMDVDWHETHVAAKLAFNLALKSEKAWFDIPYTAIERAAVPKTDADRAKHEVSGQKWVDYTDPSAAFGVSLLNNGKYGFDVKDSTLRMTMLRSPTGPDPKADRGQHRFDYALYPHKGDWRAAATPRKGFEFNYPLIARISENHAGALPAEGKSFFACEPANVILTVIKRAEDDGDSVIRVFEATGKDTTATITLPAEIASVQEVNLVEEKPDWKPAQVKIAGNKLTVPVGHFEIKSLKVKFKKAK